MTLATEKLARRVRVDALKMVHRARAAHIGSALSIADMLAVLYGAVLRFDPAAPEWPERDRFILSKGHACVGVYAVLAAENFIPADALLTYGQDRSILMNHISHHVPGVEFSTGSLGHGLPFGVGKALAAKRRGDVWRTFVLTSDGEWDEGSNWEAIMFASHHALDNLVVLIDANNLQSLTTVEDTLRLEPLADKFRAFGCEVFELDGHDHVALTSALSSAPWQLGRPSVVIARTVKGRGVSFMENQVKFHYSPPDDEQLAAALAELREPS
ncbi:transketolase [Terracoccus sp. 273MFTsu3.1]|uniref:transketolase n=1 Tax=Terracoccus sp. 273MFTsu3.1 TaxID=1172188 RepID=UPI000377F5A1|nr:transketolase [Terracoccus sp. 273MFTsu3.1]